MKRLSLGLIALLILIGLSGCGQSYEYDGLYTKDDFISSSQSVKFCTVLKGKSSISWLMKQARSNPAIEIDLNEVKTISLNDLKELTLKYPLTGELKLTIGTDIGSWKKLGYKPFETPCINSDKTLNFINHISTPYSKKTKEGLVTLIMNDDTFNKVQKSMKQYKDVPVYVIVWESVSGRKVDVGWTFKIK